MQKNIRHTDGKTYIAIDLKSFYASVECMQRGLDPLTAFLVVADVTRTSKTICLAVSPALKALGVPGRPRLFEVEQRVKTINSQRRVALHGAAFDSKATDSKAYEGNPFAQLDFMIAPPQMARYMEVSTKIYRTYLKYVAPEDIHVYSIDEVFIDATPYLAAKAMSAHDFAMMLIRDVLKTTGITATAGVGPNLYLAKIAMDIEAKHCEPDADGVRIAELTVRSYKEKLWNHTPISDFWRVGKGYAKRLADNGMLTMGDVARCSLIDEEKLFSLFGVNAELLIDHAWGYEPCTISDIKSYQPEGHSLGAGQVLQEPTSFDRANLIVREMADQLALDLVEKGMQASGLVMTVDYDVENLTNPKLHLKYTGEIKTDNYGRKVPKCAHGSMKLKIAASSSRLITKAADDLFRRIVNPVLLVRKISIAATEVVPFGSTAKPSVQPDLFGDEFSDSGVSEQEKAGLAKEKKVQEVLLSIRKKFGKNAILKAMSFQEGATARQRNGQIGGHKA